jgi:hypothetical protein
VDEPALALATWVEYIEERQVAGLIARRLLVVDDDVGGALN